MSNLTPPPKQKHPTLEEYKWALVAALRCDQSAGNALLNRLYKITGRTHTWDHIYLSLWFCEDLMPEDVWEQFCYQSEQAIPVSFAYAARSFGGLDLQTGFLETGNFDAMAKLWNGL